MNAFLIIATTPPADTDSLGRGVALVLALALLGIVLVGAVALGAAVRRARRMRAEAAKRRPTERSDAWGEAGRRVQPEEKGEDDAAERTES